VIAFGDPNDPQEFEILWEEREHPGSPVRLLLIDRQKTRFQFPPVLDEHPSQKVELTLAGQPVHLGFVDSRFGQFEAVWSDERWARMCLIKARPKRDRIWSENFLTEIVRAGSSLNTG
jgi:hypothetical protein